MTPGHDEDAIDWARVEALFPDLLELSPAQRPRFLDHHCRHAPALRRELEAMLAASSRATALDRAPQVVAQPDAIGDVALIDSHTRIGAWKVVRLIGRGGMGEVYLAERAEGGFTQQAAIKLLHRDASQHAERFEEERRILAQLSHPNIARLLDGGFHEGRAWMAMEFVPGHTITEHCRVHALPLQARLKLFHQACAAVAHAHGALVIHRDLKPSNILVSDNGQVKLLDFGIAKLIDPHATAVRATHTTAFTPDHAAPEQIEGGQITIATDLYALGVVLYEMLAARLPWSFGDTPLSRAIDRLLREDPPPPSQAARDATAGAVPADLLQGDLDAIVARCLRRLPQDRYPTVQALQDDLDRYARRMPVRAREGGRAYVTRLWLRRNRALAGMVAVASLSLLSGLGAALWQADVARREAAHAVAQQRLAEQQRAMVRVQADSSLAVQDLLAGMFARSLAMDGGTGTTVRDLVDAIRAAGARQGGDLDTPARAQLFLRLARISASAGDAAGAQAMLEEAKPLVAATQGMSRPRLLAQLLDVRLTLALSGHDLASMMRLAPPLLRLLDTLPQPLDEEMLQLRLGALRAHGWALDQMGRHDEAIDAKRLAWQANLARYGEAHPRSRLAQGSYGRALALGGRQAEGAAVLRAALRGMQAASAPSPMNLINTSVSLVEALRQLEGGLPEARRRLADAEAIAREQAARLPQFYLPWLQALQADILREQGRLGEASALLEDAGRFRPDSGKGSAAAVHLVVLTAQADLAWARGDAASSARHLQTALAALGTPAEGDDSEHQRLLGLRLRMLRTKAASMPPPQVRAQVAALVQDLDAMPSVSRVPCLRIAAETLRLAGLEPDAVELAKRAVASH